MNDLRISILKAIANPTRLKLIDALRKKPLTVGELCKVTGFEQSRVSHSLKYLAERCFVKAEKQGRMMKYSLNKETILPIVIMVDEHIKRHKKFL